MGTICRVNIRLVAAALIGLWPAQSYGKDDKYVLEKETETMSCLYSPELKPATFTMRFGSTGKRFSSPGLPAYDVYIWTDQRGRKVTFRGQGGFADIWWSGTLNGKRAVGYTINKGHFIVSALDYSFEFECWLDGYRHGTY